MRDTLRPIMLKRLYTIRFFGQNRVYAKYPFASHKAQSYHCVSFLWRVFHGAEYCRLCALLYDMRTFQRGVYGHRMGGGCAVCIYHEQVVGV